MIFGKYINRFYLKYAFFFIAGIAALIFVDWLQLYVPEYVGNVVNILQNNGDISLIKGIALKVILVAFGMFAGRVVWRFAIFHASQKIESELRHDMFVKAEKLSRNFYHENKVGTVMAWFTNDLENIEEYLGWGTIMIIDAIFLSILTIIKMVRLDLMMSIICFIPAILIVIWGALVEKYMMIKWNERQNAYDSLYDFSQENFTGIRVIKAFIKENQEIHAFAKVAKKNADVNVNFVRISVLFDVFIQIIIALIFALILGFGGWFAWSNIVAKEPVVLFGQTVDMSADRLVEFTGYFDTLIWPMIALGQTVSMRSRCKTSLKRISQYLDTPEDIKNPENPIKLDNVKGEISFKNFSFRYTSSNYPTLNNITLTIKAGESVGVVGKIGCGKTTLANALLMLYNVNKDSVFIDGNDIMSLDIESLRNNISYVPQDNFLFSDSVMNNINFFDKNQTLELAKEGAKFAGVDQDIEGFKNGYDTVTGERGVTLSGGQKQRISIARAYVKHSPILILDDSVSAVDTKTEETILKNITEQRKGKTTLVVASRISTVSHLDKIIVLNEGNLEGFDTPANLLKTCETYKKMVALQELEKEVEGVK